MILTELFRELRQCDDPIGVFELRVFAGDYPLDEQ